MPHIAAQENWTTTFTLVNIMSGPPATTRLSMFGESGTPLQLPLVFPQRPSASGPLLAASLDRTFAPNASLVIATAGPSTPPVQIGSAQLSAGEVDGFAIFHLIPGAQEAAAPFQYRNASFYLLPFDNTNGVVLGVALANISTQAANIPVVIRDDAGVQIATGSLTLAGSGHKSFVLSDQFPITTDKRGTIEFDTPASGPINALGIRTTPFGGSTTLTFIPAVTLAGRNKGSMAHLAVGNGWKTTFVLVNAGSSVAQTQLKFFDDNGAPLVLPLAFPQSGGGTSAIASGVDRTLAAGAMLLIESIGAPADPLLTGSAQLAMDGDMDGFVIFRYQPNGQEAVVPLERRQAPDYLLRLRQHRRNCDWRGHQHRGGAGRQYLGGNPRRHRSPDRHWFDSSGRQRP
jgi:hypothetical protein